MCGRLAATAMSRPFSGEPPQKNETDLRENAPPQKIVTNLTENKPPRQNLGVNFQNHHH